MKFRKGLKIKGFGLYVIEEFYVALLRISENPQQKRGGSNVYSRHSHYHRSVCFQGNI
jgi:hypothetical protein